MTIEQWLCGAKPESNPDYLRHETHRPRLEYAAEALLMFTAAGRWCPLDRLSISGIGYAGRQAVHVLRQRGWRIEEHETFAEYRLARE